MPLYSYGCKCGHHFDEIYKIDDRDIPETLPCPACDKIGTVSKLIGSPNIVASSGGHISKVPTDFRNHLQGMKNFYKGSKINV